MNRIILIAAALFSNVAAANDGFVNTWTTVKDTAVAKSTIRQYLLEATDGDGEMIGSLKQYTWRTSSYAQYVSADGDTHVQVKFTRGQTYGKVWENGVASEDGFVSPQAALLVLRLQEQINQTDARIPMYMVSADVDCQVLWTGLSTEIGHCSLTPVLDLP